MSLAFLSTPLSIHRGVVNTVTYFFEMREGVSKLMSAMNTEGVVRQLF
jgi:hypothetical protein